MTRRPRVYLAGPDVFLPEPAVLARAKQELCATYGFTGVSPIDNEIDVAGLRKREAALKISVANEEMIRGCHLVIANLTPFRGPSADVGTAYEMGFARALGLPVFAYTNVAEGFVERMRSLPDVGVRTRPDGRLEDGHGMALEDFDLVDNLMLEGAVESSGAVIVVNPTPTERRFTDLTAFEACLRAAACQLVLPKR